MKQDFISRWFRGETRWNAIACMVVAVLCAGTALFVAAVAPRSDIVTFNVFCSVANLLCAFMFRARYRAWLEQHGPERQKPR